MESYGKINKDSLSAEQRELLDSVKPREGMFENLDRLKNESILMVGVFVFFDTQLSSKDCVKNNLFQKGFKLQCVLTHKCG